MKKGNGEIAGLHDMNYPPWERGVRQGGMLNEWVMQRNLINFKKIMDKNDIPFVAIFGTLLGFVREGKPVITSKDADFFCYAKDHYKMKSVINSLKSYGFHIVDRNDSPLGDHHIIRGGEKIEIWWFQKINKEWVYDDRVRYEAKYFDNLQTIKVLGKDWLIPDFAEENLLITYGEDWEIPNPKATYILDARKAKSIVEPIKEEDKGKKK